MKYIIVEDMGLEQAVIFSECLFHKTVASGFSKVVSAGFCSINPEIFESADVKVNVWGKSIGLNLRFRPEDEEIIKQSINFRV